MQQSEASLLTMLRKRNCVVLTGAGCSTESGIPDYRSETGVYRRKDHKPLFWQEYKSSVLAQKRYWMRSSVGYPKMRDAPMNSAHRSLERLRRHGFVSKILTQNVDGLHVKACIDQKWRGEFDNSSLCELHGNIHLVKCMHCRHGFPRSSIQDELTANNEALLRSITMGTERPDGDFDIEGEAAGFVLPICPSCKQASLRPDVVLFGENVPQPIVSSAMKTVQTSASIVCVGTSLQVYSAFRFVEVAVKRRIPIAIVNNGVTRADGLENIRIETDSVSTFLEGITHVLCP